MITFWMDSVQFYWDALKSLKNVHKIHLQRLGLSLVFFHLILSTHDLYLYKHINFNPYWANVSFLDAWKLLKTVWFSEVFRL